MAVVKAEKTAALVPRTVVVTIIIPVPRIPVVAVVVFMLPPLHAVVMVAVKMEKHVHLAQPIAIVATGPAITEKLAVHVLAIAVLALIVETILVTTAKTAALALVIVGVVYIAATGFVAVKSPYHALEIVLLGPIRQPTRHQRQFSNKY